MQKVTPFLWFDDQAEEAAAFYLAVFDDARKVSNVVDDARQVSLDGRPGKASGITIEVGGQRLFLFNGGPYFKLNEAFSLFIDCGTQAEVDYYWERLTADGGQESQCGWLKDKFGVSWQVVPEVLTRGLSDPDPEVAKRVAASMMTMTKLDVAELERAYAG
ncbi:MAG: VOC family protein [Trueperaceae bacterium]|nr:VOC family protein [Trueperaceae bacterium]MCO5173763.1 VOC family protein [Trueperaceae bacterium]MCW5819025.1 VOC family protein [Trueperaceae bacterium]